MRSDEFSLSKIVSRVVAALVAFMAVIAVFDSYTVIPPGYVGVLFNRWTGGLSVIPQGMAWMTPFMTTVQKYPVALRTYTMVQRSNEGSSTNDDSIDLPTKEGQHIRQDISVTYNTSEKRAADVFKSFNGSDVGDIESTFIRRTIITVAQNIAGQMSLSELISSKRDELQTAVEKKLEGEFDKMGFHMDKVNLGASHLPQAIEAQMQQKMAAQQTALQSEYELQKQQTLAKAKVAEAEGDAQANIIRAKAQAQANDITLKALSPNLIEYEKIKKWNGVLPQFTGGTTPLIQFHQSAEK
jgi:regulator of protease activity HflC (stomatin/prohibitin superfamily)